MLYIHFVRYYSDPLMSVNRVDKKLETSLSIMYSTPPLSVTSVLTYIIGFTHFRQSQQKLNIINFGQHWKYIQVYLIKWPLSVYSVIYRVRVFSPVKSSLKHV